MPATRTPRDLLLHELRDMYYVETELTEVLPELADESTDKELTGAFQHHLRETQRHVKNLESAFKELGERAQPEQCPGFDGLKAEHDEFMRDGAGTTVVRDLFLSGAAARTEHYEIAAYTGMAALARALGEKKIVALLEKNLKDEKEALRTVDKIGRRVGREGTKENGRVRANSRRRATRGPASNASGPRPAKSSGRRAAAKARR